MRAKATKNNIENSLIATSNNDFTIFKIKTDEIDYDIHRNYRMNGPPDKKEFEEVYDRSINKSDQFAASFAPTPLVASLLKNRAILDGKNAVNSLEGSQRLIPAFKTHGFLFLKFTVAERLSKIIREKDEQLNESF